MTVRAMGAVLVLLAMSGCGDPTSEGQPGTLVVSIATPHGDDGAVALTISGTGLTNVAPTASGYRVFWRLVADDQMRVLIFGTITSGPVLSVTVGDVRRPETYTGTVTEAATRTDALREDVSGYAVTFVPATE